MGLLLICLVNWKHNVNNYFVKCKLYFCLACNIGGFFKFPKVHCRVLRGERLDPILRKFNPAYILFLLDLF
jgi:hypothetical protein